MNTDLLQQIAVWGSSIAAGVAATMLAVRRYSSTHTALANDSTERDMLKLLMRERDDAHHELADAVAARQLCAASLARMTAEKEALQADVHVLNDNFGAWQRKIARLYPQTRQFMDSAVMPFQENAP